MTGSVHIGCSGWIYRHWRELFYPAKLPQRLWYAHYADTFSTVELNTSFYHLPRPETFTKWREQAPPGFRYAVKAPRFITHMKKLMDCREAVEEFLRRARNLGPAIGPILYQLPPRWAAGPIAYVRFHGGEGKYWGRYSDEGLLAWTDWIVGQALR